MKVMRCMCAQTRPRFILSSERVFFFFFWGGGGGDGVRTHVNSKGKKNPLYRTNSPQRRIEPTTLHQVGQRAQHTTNELSRPHWSINAGVSDMTPPGKSSTCKAGIDLTTDALATRSTRRSYWLRANRWLQCVWLLDCLLNVPATC